MAKIIGLKTFTTLKEFRGHKSYVLSGSYSYDYKQIITAGTDGTVKIWDLGSGQCTFSLCPRIGNQISSFPIINIIPRQSKLNSFIVATNDKEIMELSAQGKFKSIFSLSSGTILGCCLTVRCEYLYAITSDSFILTIELQTGNLLGKVQVSAEELITIKAHPFMNIIIISDVKGNIYFYEPEIE